MATERQCKRNFQDFEDDNVDFGHGQAPDRTVTDVPLPPFAASPPPKHLGGGLECFEEEGGDLDEDMVGFVYPDFNVDGSGPSLSDLDEVIGNFDASFSADGNFHPPCCLCGPPLTLGIDVDDDFESTEITTLGTEVEVWPVGAPVPAVSFVRVLTCRSLTIPIAATGRGWTASTGQMNRHQAVRMKKVEFDAALLLLRDRRRRRRSGVCRSQFTGGRRQQRARRGCGGLVRRRRHLGAAANVGV